MASVPACQHWRVVLARHLVSLAAVFWFSACQGPPLAGTENRIQRQEKPIAIATWWLLSVGGEAEAQTDMPLDIKEPSVPDAVRRRGKRWRIVGIFLHGWFLIIAALLNHRLLPVKPGRPEAWPRLSESYQTSLAACMAGSGE